MNARAPFSTAPTSGIFYYEEMDSESLFSRITENVAICRRTFKVLHLLYPDLEVFKNATYLPGARISRDESEKVIALLADAADELRIYWPEHYMTIDDGGSILHHFIVFCWT